MRSLFAHLIAILRLRCPRCLRGKVFAGLIKMHDSCPHCHVCFLREPGYFLGAMYASYFLGAGFLGVFFVISAALFPDWPSACIAAIAVVPYLPLIPFVFRYSRVIWMHIDVWDKFDADTAQAAKVVRPEVAPQDGPALIPPASPGGSRPPGS
jgi:uncharacterized protein (DUF983 family)